MRVETKSNPIGWNPPESNAVDVSLLNPPTTEQASVPVDQMMVAVEGVRRYVISHLSRIGRASDVDDVMQDIRVAVWDGVSRGRYRPLPGVRFGAWVQGVASNICSAHIRRELSHPTLPLLMDPGTAEDSAPFDVLTVLVGDRHEDRGADMVLDQEWAQKLLGLTRAAVSPDVWGLAVASLSGPRKYGPPSPQDRRRWNAVTVVRQTAKTVNTALETDHGTIRNFEDLCTRAVECLPSPLLRGVAETIVRPDVHGPERREAIAALASELGVTERYVAVQIGSARRLYQTAWRTLRGAMKPGC
ncbi:sigma factor [Arthrobacter rhizosphaerae]|uniref:sigma factor n=1 Tax=Arthrobacter rhizosphaerae TaxID=2855490 RepID=UPI001FF3455F|nr:sigma factor [Arthrobacter rhizosphaerae]